MYNTREALAYSGKLPEQQGQAAITPQLLDLLALQKVEADKKAAAQQLALATGQAQPTVAQGLQQRAMQSARQEISQKMGLAGLAQPSPPAGPMPQQPAPQGLAGAPSNLPAQYQGGGIIAFAQGGSGGDAHGRFRQKDEDAVEPDSEDQGPQMSPQNAARIERQWTALESMRDQDPEVEAQKAMALQQSMLNPAREAAIAHKREQQAGLKALYERQKSERPSDLQVALDRMAQNIRQPGGLGAAMLGVTPAVTAAHQGYTTQEINQLNALSAIDDEIDKAIENNDVSKYNALVSRRKEVEGQVQKGIETGATMSDVLERTLAGKQRTWETVEGRKQAAATLAQQKATAAAQADVTKRELAKDRLLQLQIAQANAAGRKDEAAQLRREQLAQQARISAVANASKEMGFAMMSPEEQEASIQKHMQWIMPTTTAAPMAAPMSAPPPGAVRLKK
jgi:hypothetical protein